MFFVDSVKKRLLKTLIAGLICLLTVGLAVGLATGQSGRGQLPESQRKKPQKPRLPEPLPKVRMPEQLPQPSEDTIRINSDLVTIVATITSNLQNDRLDLNREDFEILEDGIPQEISNFARDQDLPINLVMLFDSSLSVAQKIAFERRAAAKFFERVMRPEDRAALFSVSTDVVVLQDFTGNIKSLVNATRQLKSQGATSLYDAVYLASDYLKATQGRRVIVVVSDGGDTTSNKGLLDALARVQQSDCVVFAVYTGNLNYSQNLRDLAGERALETLTNETGGEVLRPGVTPGTQGDEADEQSLRELDRAFISLAEHLRTQFTLGYFSSNDKRDGSFRKLVVHIKKKGYTARTRTGYYAPKS